MNWGVDQGLLILRMGLGMLFLYYGWPNLWGGPPAWKKLGNAIHGLGISGNENEWGLIGAITQCLGGCCILLGIFFQPACLFLSFLLVVALVHHFKNQGGFAKSAFTLEHLFFVCGLFIAGPGRFTLPPI